MPLHALRHCRSPRRVSVLQRLVLLQAQRRDPGLTLLVALVAAVVIVTAAASLTARTLSTQMGASSLGASREAHEAAEAGHATVISELNRQRNRQLLTAPVGMAAWSLAANTAALTNACANSTEPTPDPNTLALGQGTSREVIGSNGQLRFTLVSMEVNTADRRESFRSDSTGAATASAGYSPRKINPDDPNAFGYLRLVVRGDATSKTGNVSSTTIIKRDYKLIPKGCSRSPAADYGYGNDTRPILMRPLIVGFNGGGFTSISQGSNINPGLNQAICLIQPNTGRCGGDNPANVDRIPVLPMALGATFDTWLPPAQRYPCPGGGLCTTPAPPVDPADTATVPPPPVPPVSTPNYYIGIGEDGNVRYCSTAGSPGSGISPLTCGMNSLVLNGFCEPSPTTPNTPRHCRLDRISLAAESKLYIDTSRAPIYLYINDSWSNNTPISIAPGQGNLSTSIIHTYCPPNTPGLTGDNGCMNVAPLPSPITQPRAMIFTDIASTLSLSSTETISGVFLWAPKLTLNVGNANNQPAFHGSLWVNTLSLGPGSEVTFWDDIPAGSTATGTPFPEMTNAGKPIGPFRNLSYDVVARPCSSKGCAGGFLP